MSRRRSLFALAAASAATAAVVRIARRRSGQELHRREGRDPDPVAPPRREPAPAVTEPARPEPPTAVAEEIQAIVTDELGDRASGLQLSPRAVSSTATTRIHPATRHDGADLLVEVRVGGTEDLRPGSADQQLMADLFHDHPLVEVAGVINGLSTAGVRTTADPGGTSITEAQAAGEPDRRAWAETLWRLAFGTLRRNGIALVGLSPELLRFLPDGRVAVVRLGEVEHLEPEAMEWYGSLVRAALDGDDDRIRQAVEDLGGAAPPSWYAPVTGERGLLADEVAAGPGLPPEAAPVDHLHVAIAHLLGELDAEPPIPEVMAELWRGVAPATPLGRAEADWWQQRKTVTVLDRLADRST